nr:RtcB family protein [Arthrobacter sp. RIT-PI-e]
MWTAEHDVEPAALQQLRNIAALEYVHGVRVMPDVHLGKGATVGSVIAMESAISPSAVGVDIGCGVSAVRTSLTAADLPEDLRPLRLAVEAAIPVGFRGHEEWLDLRPFDLTKGLDVFWSRFKDLHPGVQKLEQRAHSQLGSLGGGNHFLEVTLDAEDRVWLALHSGSRNIGKELAERHISIAKKLPQNRDLPDPDLAVFLKGSPEMAAYRRDLEWAQEFALRSREIMMELFKDAVRAAVPGADVGFDSAISCHHNYVAEEEIDGRAMLVTRKGAIRAGSGDLGLLPGSMGTGSYIVRGLGNPASFRSASHGAGRRMSRNRARATYSVEDLIEQTRGVESRKDAGIVDEIPGAYKDLDAVIAAQSDLVSVVQHLRTILCVKG